MSTVNKEILEELEQNPNYVYRLSDIEKLIRCNLNLVYFIQRMLIIDYKLPIPVIKSVVMNMIELATYPYNIIQQTVEIKCYMNDFINYQKLFNQSIEKIQQNFLEYPVTKEFLIAQLNQELEGFNQLFNQKDMEFIQQELEYFYKEDKIKNIFVLNVIEYINKIEFFVFQIVKQKK